MFIKRIKIKNFRSIVDADVDLANYTAFVGLNDAGKSNLLRALNLFFNEHTDIGTPLKFDQDFCQLATLGRKKAKQIEIELELRPPSHYRDSDNIIWRKTYRAESNSPYEDVINRASGADFSLRSKTASWARQLQFEYVPAIRGPAFFTALKRRLYHALAKIVAPQLSGASGSFLSTLRNEVKQIEDDAVSLLGITTEFTLPVDLGDFFEVLDFESSDDNATTSLNYRGDGIQGRHIPLILKFLADQRKANSLRGKSPAETIWGFEEPENNLELLKQVDTASEFVSYSDEIQILVTTHSPAFYGQAQDGNGIRVASRVHGKTVFSPSISAESVDSQLGLLPFIQPYLSAAIEERNALLASVQANAPIAGISHRPVIFVEGSSDKLILDAVLKATASSKDDFDVVAKSGIGAGVNWVVDCCTARVAMADIKHKTVALLDNDDAGKEAAAILRRRCQVIGRDKVKCVMVGNKKGEDEIRKISASGIKIEIAIDELCGTDPWVHAEGKNWLEDRGGELVEKNCHLLSPTTTLRTAIESLLPNDEHAQRIVWKKIKAEHKGDFARYVAHLIENGYTIPPTLNMLAEEVRAAFKSKE